MFKTLTLLALASTAFSAVIIRDASCAPKTVNANGRKCKVECGTDHAGGDYSAMPTADFQGCIDACTSDPKCATAQYAISSSYCYLKTGSNPGSSNGNVNSITCPIDPPATPTCVAGPVTINGRQGSVECGVDHPGGDYASQPAASLQACENLCAADPVCKTAQYVLASQYCYMKSAISSATTNSNVNGIVFS